MKVRELIEKLEECDPEAEVHAAVMDGEPVESVIISGILDDQVLLGGVPE